MAASRHRKRSGAQCRLATAFEVENVFCLWVGTPAPASNAKSEVGVPPVKEGGCTLRCFLSKNYFKKYKKTQQEQGVIITAIESLTKLSQKKIV
ncbi:hypothetical protein BOW37_06425 [Solemya velum gill symbiont]|nr:hypothetical protein BOW37_06425 [Solemya velum gill symbiont]OOZ46218.1 hypothetical protein BOW38_07720 [Solemya velum gill symbiont]OOZ51300.1 hypothetical protein BOW40_07990 [Solemya velum gill symbiont]OOZ53853.1 hypothetical protein BOW41_08000 [Solemya velum gill symbiont]OOZ56436.1 hypothetical protein BOW42_07975 [Solemya velum gill symbiont]